MARVPKKQLTSFDLTRAGIPRKYWGVRFDLIPDEAPYKGQIATYLRDLEAEVEKGRGLFVTHPKNGTGKAQPLTAKVLTPSGFVPMGSLKVGDAVVGSDGSTHSVEGVYPQGVRPVYRVVFNDRTSTECCEEHLWYTYTAADDDFKRKGSVKSLREIMSSLTKGTKPWPGRLNHRVPLISPVEFKSVGGVTIHPYLLGIYLGEGNSSRSVRIHNPEEDIRLRVAALLPDTDCVGEDTDGVTFGVRKRVRTNHPTTMLFELERMGLRGKTSTEKFIPEAYLFASVEQRRSLLEGLMDAEGFVDGTGYEFSTSSFQLREGVTWLVRSLGGKAVVTERVPRYSYRGESREGKTSYRIRVTFDDGYVPVTSVKHLAKVKVRKHVNKRAIERVEFVGNLPVQCIKVSSPDSLYVTDDFILTHNTALACLAGMRALLKGFTVYYTMSEVYKVSAVRNQMFDEYESVSERARSVDLLIVDDFGKEYKGESGWIESELENLIRERVQAGKATILTANILPSQFRSEFTKDLASVLQESVYVLLVPGAAEGGKDWREDNKLGLLASTDPETVEETTPDKDGW